MTVRDVRVDGSRQRPNTGGHCAVRIFDGFFSISRQGKRVGVLTVPHLRTHTRPMFGQCTPPGWPRAVRSDNVLSVVYTRVGDVQKLFELFACHVRYTTSRTPTAETISPSSANGSIIIIIIVADDDDCISVRGRTDLTVHVGRTKNAPRPLRGLDVHGFKIFFFYNFFPHSKTHIVLTFRTVVLRSRPTTARDRVPFENLT